ncbi:MAG: sulfite oxidase [Planctomycetes bacterium]|nr:sulfite oxidase [Planctomycetota bacterium]
MNEQRHVILSSPENSETPLAQMHSLVTPNRLFFVRNHFDGPTIDLASWRLRIGGCVEKELELTWEQLDAMPQRSVFATMECAGNGRSFLQPAVSGVQWGAGAVGHAEWSGVPLAFVVKRARLKPETCELVFEGADSGTETGHPEPMPFARSMPLAKACDESTLLALRMNGERLEPEHGLPLRLLVPGWYGVASVKWLTRIEAVRTPFEGYFQTVKYVRQRRTGRGVVTESVGPMPVKSEIVRPRDASQIGIGATRIFGMAWAGEQAVEAVEVSTDGGVSWQRAELIGPRAPHCWNLWEYLWEVVAPGEHTLLSRAIAADGRVQPARHDPDCGGYQIDFSRPTTVRVDPTLRSDDILGDREALQASLQEMAEERFRMRLDVELALTHGAGI